MEPKGRLVLTLAPPAALSSISPQMLQRPFGVRWTCLSSPITTKYAQASIQVHCLMRCSERFTCCKLACFTAAAFFGAIARLPFFGGVVLMALRADTAFCCIPFVFPCTIVESITKYVAAKGRMREACRSSLLVARVCNHISTNLSLARVDDAAQ